MAELKIKMTNLDLMIRYGGEDITIFDIMYSYRNDGSCEAIIRQALVLLAGRENGDCAHAHDWHNARCNGMSPCDLAD